MTTDQQTTPITVSEQRCEELLRQIVSIRSVVGEETTAHLWMTARLRELGMTVEHYAVEGRAARRSCSACSRATATSRASCSTRTTTPSARSPATGPATRGPRMSRTACSTAAARSTARARSSRCSRRSRRSSPLVRRAAARSTSCPTPTARTASAARRYMADLGVIDRIGTVFSAEATSNHAVEIAYPGISTWKITAIGRTAHPTEPEHGINAVDEDGEARQAVEQGRLELPPGDSQWFKPRVTTNAHPHAPRRRLGDPGALRRGALDALAPRRDAERRARGDRRVPAQARAARTARSASSASCCRWAPAACGCRPGEVDPDHAGVKALEAAVAGRHRRAGDRAQVQRRLGRRGRADASRRATASTSPPRSRSGPATSSRPTRSTSTSPLAEVAKAAEIYARATRILLA